MAKERILIVEDETDIAELIRTHFSRAGYSVFWAASGEQALAAARREMPDLVLLDLMLPGVDGLDVCRTLKSKEETRDIPVVMLTARGEEADIVAGLELGADDYITKPFSAKVLLARVRTVLRRKSEQPGADDAILRVHGMVIHPGRHEVQVDGQHIELTATEFRILHSLARRPGWVLTRDQIVDAIHGPGYPITDRAVDVQIVGLRKKLGQAGKLIETVRGIGYRMKG